MRFTPARWAAKALTADMVHNIDKVGIQVSSVSEKEIPVKNLCLTSIQFKL